MGKDKRKKSNIVQMTYKDTLEVRQELMLLAAEQGHGKVMWVIRDAVEEYLKRHRKTAKAG